MTALGRPDTPGSTVTGDFEDSPLDPNKKSVRPKGGTKWRLRPEWKWTYLDRFSLGGLAVLSILFIAALEFLNYLSNRDQGFAAAAEGMHYLWTYGPTLGENENDHMLIRPG